MRLGPVAEPCACAALVAVLTALGTALAYLAILYL